MRGQSIVEYIMILGIVVIALYAMGPYMKRGVQSIIKGTADQLAFQKNADQDFSPDSSHLESSVTLTNTDNEDSVQSLNGMTNKVFNDSTTTLTNTITNMGFSP